MSQKSTLHITSCADQFVFHYTKRFSVCTVIALVAALSWAQASAAQEVNVTELSAKASQGDNAAGFKLGEALLYGMGGLDQNPDQAIAYLTQAAQAGNADAQLLLGEALLWGSHASQDLEGAVQWLEQAAANDRASARHILGQQLIGGWILDQDIPKGKAILEAAVEQGDAKAHIILAQFYLYGPIGKNFTRAETLVEAAAKAGDPSGLRDLGGAIMWSWRDWQKAETLLMRAADAGVDGAWTTLAEGAMFGYLGPKSRRKFEGFAEKARALGDEKVAILEAERRIWGISQRASGPKTLAGLEEAAAAGNGMALRYLISLTRDGNQYNIRKEPERARSYLQKYAVYLSPDERQTYELTIEAARERSLPGFQKIVAKVKAQPELMTPWFFDEMYKANANVVFYLVQEREKARGAYTGAMDGLAGPKTVRATYKACVDLPYRGGPCGASIFKSEMVGQLLVKR